VQFAPLRGTNQALYYINRAGPFSMRRVVYLGGTNSAPVAIASITSNGLGTIFSFDATESYDPDGDSLQYHWDFGDGSVSTDRMATHQYFSKGIYTVSLTVTDDRGASSKDSQEIQFGAPPTVTIRSPAVSQFAVGDVFVLQGSATDSDGNAIADAALSWEVLQHHATHFHPFLQPTSGNSIQMPPAPGPEGFLAATNSYLEILLTATDADGLKTTVTLDILPITYLLQFSTNPSGFNLIVDGFDLSTNPSPLTLTAWKNQAIVINAPETGPTRFISWSDGGEQTHSITITGDAIFEATYGVPTPVPTTPAPVAPPTTPAPTEPPIPTTAPPETCEVPFTGPDYNIGVSGLDVTETIDTSCVGDVTVRMIISHSGRLEASGVSLDFLNTYIMIDSNPFESWLEIVGDQYTATNEITVATGEQLKIRTFGDTSHSSEQYQIRNFEVFPAAPPSGCDVPWSGPNFVITNAGGGGTASVDTSCVNSVRISFDISHTGSLENSGPSLDSLQVIYQLDGGTTTSIVDVLGDGYSPNNVVEVVTSGNKMVIGVSGSTTAGSESYRISNLKIEDVPTAAKTANLRAGGFRLG